jgi:hypothetical protein
MQDDFIVEGKKFSELLDQQMTPEVAANITNNLSKKDEDVYDQLRNGPLYMPEVMLAVPEFVSDMFSTSTQNKERNIYTRLQGMANQADNEGNKLQGMIYRGIAKKHNALSAQSYEDTIELAGKQKYAPDTVQGTKPVTPEELEYAKQGRYYSNGLMPEEGVDNLKMVMNRFAGTGTFTSIAHGVENLALSGEELEVAQARQKEHEEILGEQFQPKQVEILGAKFDVDMNLVTSGLLPVGGAAAGVIKVMGMAGIQAGLDSYGKGNDESDAILTGLLGAAFVGAVGGVIKGASHAFKGVDGKILSKLEKLAKFEPKELNTIYGSMAKTIGKTMDELTVQDKFIALAKENKTIHALYVDGANTSEAATATTKKAREHTMAIINKLTTIGKGSAGQLKEQLRKENKQSLAYLRDTIGKSTAETDRAFAEFREQMYDQEIAPKNITALLQEVKDEMSDTLVTSKAFKKIVKDLEIKLDKNGELPDEVIITNRGQLVTLIQHLDQKYTSTPSASLLKREQNMPANYLIGNLQHELEDGLDAMTKLEFQELLDVKNVNDRFLNNLAVRKLLRAESSDDISKALRNFMKTDSYASLTSFLPPKAVAEIENVVMKGIFTRSDTGLGEDIATNFWALAKEVDDISYIASPRAKAVVNLIRNYRDYLGSLKKAGTGQSNVETGLHSRINPIEEVQSRAVAGMFKNIIQYLPTDIGRQTYIVNNMAKIIKGETVLGQDASKTLDMNELLIYKATSNLVRTDISNQDVTFKTARYPDSRLARYNEIDFELDKQLYRAVRSKVQFKTVHEKGLAGEEVNLNEVFKNKISGLEDTVIIFKDMQKPAHTITASDGNVIVLSKNLMYKNADSDITLERALTHEIQHVIDVAQNASSFGTSAKSPEVKAAYTEAIKRLIPDNVASKEAHKILSDYLNDTTGTMEVLVQSYKDMHKLLLQTGYSVDQAKQMLKLVHPMELYLSNLGEVFARSAERTIGKAITKADLERHIQKAKGDTMVEDIDFN